MLAKNDLHASSIAGDHGMTIVRKGGEYRVNFRGGKEATAYYTNDRQDAVNTAIDMSKRLLTTVNQPENTDANPA